MKLEAGPPQDPRQDQALTIHDLQDQAHTTLHRQDLQQGQQEVTQADTHIPPTHRIITDRQLTFISLHFTVATTTIIIIQGCTIRAGFL